MNLVLALILGSLFILWIYGKFIFPLVDNYNDRGSGIAVVLVIVLIFTSMFTWTMYFEPHEELYEEHYFYMESLGNDKYLEGGFTLGTGSISEIDYYFFFANTTNGMKRLKVPVSDTYLIERDIDRPKIMMVLKRINDEDLFFKNFEEPNTRYSPAYYKMYVPKGTIIKDFKVR